MLILKATPLFDGHLMKIYITCRITPLNDTKKKKIDSINIAE